MHEDSDECKFGKGCEKTLCTYKHESINGEEVETVESDADSDSDDESIDLDVEDIKPVVEKLEEAFEKLSVNLKKHFGPLKCDSYELRLGMRMV